MTKKQWRDDINSRVQELRDLAAEAYVKSTGNCSHFTAVGLPNGFVQQFAEMLVQELVTKCQTDWYGDSLDDICKKMCQTVASSDPDVV